MPRSCFYPECTNTILEKFMFPFPILDEKRISVWIQNTGNEDLLNHDYKKELLDKYICCDHFLAKDLYHIYSGLRLKKKAVPIAYQRSDGQPKLKVLKPSKVYSRKSPRLPLSKSNVDNKATVLIKVEPLTIEEYPQLNCDKIQGFDPTTIVAKTEREDVNETAFAEYEEPGVEEKFTINKMEDDIDIVEHDVLDDPQIQNMNIPDLKRIKTEVLQEGDGNGYDTQDEPRQLRQKSESTKASTTKVQTITSRIKTNAQKCREYRERTKLKNTMVQNITAERSDACSETDPLPAKKPKTNAERRKKHYEAHKLKKQESKNKKIPKTAKQRNKEYYYRKKKNLALNTLNHHSDATAYNHTMADQPDELMDLTDLPTIAAPKSKALKQREYRQRKAASRTPAQEIAKRKSDAERQRNRRLRKAVKSALVSGSLESTTASSSRSGTRSNDVQTGTQQQFTNQQRQTSAAEPVQPGISFDQIEVRQAQYTWNTKWASSIMRFKSTFLDNDFGYACSVCDRLWFKNDLKPITAAQLEVISEWFIKENRRLCREEYAMVCYNCKRILNKKSMPLLAKVNGFSYPEQPPGLPPLDPISERLISPRLPFMQVRRLRHDLSNGIISQVINVPVDVQEMVKCLPRQLNEDDVVNVNIKGNLAHKSVYISEYMSKNTISAWLTVLQKSQLYRLYEINVNLSRLHPTVPFLNDLQDDPSNLIENISAENTPESEILASRQHTMMWNKEYCLNIAPGHETTPFNLIYDCHAEELSFPSIYFGEPRRFNMGVSVTPYMIAASEIRRRDRRGATPQKILYVAMKIMRLRMVNGIYSMYRNVSATENADVTRRMLEDTEFLKKYVIQNLSFMKTVPNSVQYWASRKRDLFAIIHQLGKPTVFLTISANETRWIKLLTILLKLSKKYPGKTAKDLNTSERCTLVSDDPVTCCIYFYKLVGSLLKMLKCKQSYNPFGNYFVKDYFVRIEFQHRGSPHAHILLWLNDDPRETVSENMPKTIELVEKLSSVARVDVPSNSIYANQIHKHTFTCTKRGETTCRFGIPYWPMPTTRVLVPIPQSDGRRQTLQQKAKELRTSLSERRYACMDEFLNANGLTYVSYLDIVRSTLRRPTLVFRRNFDELMTNTFNPYLAGEVNSNIDIQFILDEYSCAEFVVEYVNKSARGMGNLRRELTTMMQEHPVQDFTGQLKELRIKLLNAFEMSAQEAAWYLLRQPMSETSRQVVYIPTVWPTERQCCRKRRQQMDREGIDGDSTDVWIKNIIQRYEERPASLEQVYLAEFAAWYASANDFVDEEDVNVDDEEDSVPEARTSRAPKEYRRRLLGRVIRYRRYDIDETDNYKREMVLLYVQFRNEMSEIVDQNKFLQLFDDNKDTIIERRSLFETNLNIENVMKELEAVMTLKNDNNSNLQEESRAALDQRLLGEDGAENVDDVNQTVLLKKITASKKMADNIDIEEHDVLDNPLIKNTFPDLTRIKTEVPQEEDECPNEDFTDHITNVTVKVEPHTIEVEFPQFRDIENEHLNTLVKEPKMKGKNTINKMANDIAIKEHDVFDNPQIQNMFPDLTRIKTEVLQEEDELPFEDFADHNTVPFKIDPRTIKAEYPQSDSEIIQELEPNLSTIVPKLEREDHEHLDATALNNESKNTDVCKMKYKNVCVCATCQIHFESQRTLIQHKCTSVRSKTCNVCNKKIDHESFKVHYALHEENRTKSETMMMKHELLHAIWNILYQCAVCSTVTDSYDVAVEHSQAHYSQMESFGVILQNCDICKLAFKSDCYQKHKELHQGAKLNRESFNIVQFNYLHLHSAKWFEMFRLLEPKILDLILSTSMYKDTRSVRMKMLQDGNNGDTMYLCVSCNRIVDAKDVKTHAFNENICSDVEYSRQCTICQYKFASEAQFNQHSNGTHGNIKGYRILVFNSVEDQAIISAMRNNAINEASTTLADNLRKPIILCQKGYISVDATKIT